MITILLRAGGFLGLVFGLFLSSYCYWSPGIQQQNLMAGYEASQNKDAYAQNHPGFNHVPNEDERAEQLVNVIYGLGLAIVGVGSVLISYKMEAVAAAGAS